MIAFFLFFVIPIGILIISLSYVLAKALEPPKTIAEIVDEVLKEKSKDLSISIAKELMKDPQILFLKQIQWELMRVNSDLDASKAFSTAKVVLSEFLKDSKIEFGDPNFEWKQEDAIELAWAYEIEYWDEN